jgi:thioredoxin reductase
MVTRLLGVGMEVRTFAERTRQFIGKHTHVILRDRQDVEAIHELESVAPSVWLVHRAPISWTTRRG